MSDLGDDMVSGNAASCTDTDTVLASDTPTCRFEQILFEPERPVWKCPHPADFDGLCIYHLPKISLDDRSKLPAPGRNAAEQLDTRCRLGIAALITETEQAEATKAHEFIGFQCPPGFGLSNKDFTKPVSFRSACF